MRFIKGYVRMFSISSKDLPLVSGKYFKINRNPAKQMPAYTQNVPAAPSPLFNSGNVKVNTKQAIQSPKVAKAIAAPLMRLGNISESITHTIGANDMA